MQIAISGATGLVGSSLADALTGAEDEVVRLVRRDSSGSDVLWDPTADSFDASALADCEAVVHLAGENIASGRWSAAKKQRIRESRVHSTRLLAEGLAACEQKPRVLICASAIGFYGSSGETLVDEQSPAGDDFLARVCQDWEAASQPARDAGNARGECPHRGRSERSGWCHWRRCSRRFGSVSADAWAPGSSS